MVESVFNFIGFLQFRFLNTEHRRLVITKSNESSLHNKPAALTPINFKCLDFILLCFLFSPVSFAFAFITVQFSFIIPRLWLKSFIWVGCFFRFLTETLGERLGILLIVSSIVKIPFVLCAPKGGFFSDSG